MRFYNNNTKLKEFIKKLKVIVKEKGDDAEVLMADFIPVVSPKFSNTNQSSESKSRVFITDQE